jgi:hypothetical protein
MSENQIILERKTNTPIVTDTDTTGMARLLELESVIDRGLQTFVEVGQALR